MTKEEIKELGWEEKTSEIFRFKEHPASDYYLLIWNKLEEVDSIIIKYVERALNVNIVENSDTIFAGVMKTKEELSLVMEFLEIIEYKGL